MLGNKIAELEVAQWLHTQGHGRDSGRAGGWRSHEDEHDCSTAHEGTRRPTSPSTVLVLAHCTPTRTLSRHTHTHTHTQTHSRTRDCPQPLTRWLPPWPLLPWPLLPWLLWTALYRSLAPSHAGPPLTAREEGPHRQLYPLSAPTRRQHDAAHAHTPLMHMLSTRRRSRPRPGVNNNARRRSAPPPPHLCLRTSAPPPAHLRTSAPPHPRVWADTSEQACCEQMDVHMPVDAWPVDAWPLHAWPQSEALRASRAATSPLRASRAATSPLRASRAATSPRSRCGGSWWRSYPRGASLAW